ncbi:flavodoxin [Lactiplantibacillus plantarum]|uniref:flavodoxin n=1 Tax=Lactiplantibacillus plantarum TaxID=1590 RepID=UPI003C15DD74
MYRFPTWWRQPPMIIHTLFDTVNFKNKTIVPFTTSMESPISSSVPYLQKMADKDGAKLVKGIRYTNNNNLKRFLITNDLITK